MPIVDRLRGWRECCQEHGAQGLGEFLQARVARAAFPKGSPYLRLRDELGPDFRDGDFADLYPRRGQPALSLWRLALVTRSR